MTIFLPSRNIFTQLSIEKVFFLHDNSIFCISTFRENKLIFNIKENLCIAKNYYILHKENRENSKFMTCVHFYFINYYLLFWIHYFYSAIFLGKTSVCQYVRTSVRYDIYLADHLGALVLFLSNHMKSYDIPIPPIVFLIWWMLLTTSWLCYRLCKIPVI